MAGATCCLLCLETLDDTIGHTDIDSTEGQAMEAQQIIEQYFWQEVNTTSAQTRTVCRQCWETVSTFHQFYLRVQRAHIALGQCDIALGECDIALGECDIAPAECDVAHDSECDVAHDSECDVAHDSESWSEDKAPQACEEQLEENNVDIERLFLPANETNILVEEQHINDIKQEEVEFVVLDCSTDEEYSDETSSSEDDSGSEMERVQKKKHKMREKSRKADAFIADNFNITCEMCGVAAKTFAELQLHFEMQHQTSGYVICCGRKIKHRATLVDHLYLHRNPQHFKCPKCGKAVSSSVALRNHIKAHRDPKKRRFNCDNCEKTYSSRASLKRHVDTHIPERLYPCAECGKAYPSEKSMNYHMKMVHQNPYVKICEACGKSVRGVQQLRIHMQKHMSPKLAIKCDKCDRILTSERGLKIHMETVHQRYPQTCPICSRVSQSLRAHQRHMHYHHKLTPKHACALCDKVFKRPDHLKVHISSHTKESSFACMFCPRTYSSGNSRYMHCKNKHPKELEEHKKKKVEQSKQ